MPSLRQRLTMLERATTSRLLPNDEPIVTLAELFQVNARVMARSKHSAHSSEEEGALAKSDHLRLIDAYKNGTVLALVQAFEEAYAQGPSAAEQFLQAEGFTVEESRRFHETWSPATQDPSDSQTNAGERR